MTTISIVTVLKGFREAEKAVNSLGSRLTNVGQSAVKAGKALTKGLTLPIAGVGIAAAKLASDFDASLSQIVGLVGLSADEVDGMRDAVLSLSGETAKSPRELADALFFITSAGARGQEALDILANSAKAASAGLGDATVIADAVTSAINAFGAANLDAGRATGILVAAVREGKASAETLAPVLGRVLPLAAQLGVGFDELAASIAAMSRLGLNAAESSTALRGVLAALLDPSSQAEKALEGFGLSSEGLRESLRSGGLLATLSLLKDTFGDNQQAMAAVFPQIESLTGVLNLVGENAEQTRQIFQSLATATEEDLAKAFDVAAGTSGLKFQQAMAQIQVLLIRLGDAILPVVVPALEVVVNAVEAAANAFASLDPVLQQVGVVFAAVLGAGGPILLAVGTAAKVIGALVAVSGPIGLLIAAASIAVLAYQNWDKIVEIVGAMVEGVRFWLVDNFGPIIDFVGEKVAAVTAFFEGMFNAVVGESFVPDMIARIGEEFAKLGGNMVRPTEVATEQINSAMETSAIQIDGFAKDMLSSFAQSFKGVLSGATSFSDSMKSLFRDMVADILAQLAKLAISAGLNAIVPGLGSIVGGFFQHGGSFVATAPQLIAVGEVGPERVTVSPLGTPAPGGGGERVFIIQTPLVIGDSQAAERQLETILARISRRSVG